MTLKKLKIRDVCLTTDYVANGSFASLKENVKYLDGDGYAVLVRLTDFTKNWKNSFRYVSKHAYEFLKHSKLYPGDLIISNVGEPGKTFLVPDLGKPTTLGPNSILIRPDNSILSTQYLKYFIDSNSGQKLIDSIVSGTTQKKFNKTSLRNLEITIPSIKEQQRIVAKLDSAFAEIDKMTKITMNKKNQITSFYESSKTNIFENLLDFEEKPLKEVCEKITDGTHQTPKYFDSGYIFLSSRNVKSKKIDWDNIKYIDEKQHLEMQKRLCPRRGDVLLAKNGTTGMGAIVDRDINFDIYVSLALLRSKGDVLPEFLLEFINSKLANEQFSKRTKGIGVPNLHLQEIREVVIKYPKSKVEQNILIKKLNFLNEQYDKLQSITEMKFQNLLSLKSSLLKKELQSA